MAFIADLLHSYVKDNLDRLVNELNGDVNPLLEDFRKLVNDLWVSTSFEEIITYDKVAAVDGGLIKFKLANGGSIVIASAYGFGNGIEERDVDCSIIYPPHKDYASLLMKTLELKVARRMVRKILRGGLLLLDGSLYGLFSTIPLTPRRAPYGYGKLLLNFYSELNGLMDDCKAHDVKVLSLTKTSSSSFLRDYCLYLMHKSEIDKLRTLFIIEPKDLGKIEALLYTIFRSPIDALKIAENLRSKYGKIVGRIELIAREGLTKTTDLLILKRCDTALGYTRPLLLGPSSRLRDIYEHAIKNVKDYTERRFLLPSEMSKKVYETLNSIKFLSAIISTYVKFDKRDYPLKIDLPATSLGINRYFFEIGMPEPVDIHPDFTKLLSILKGMYASREVYNVWLHEADRRARLRRVEMTMMLEILDKSIGPIELSRRPLPEPSD